MRSESQVLSKQWWVRVIALGFLVFLGALPAMLMYAAQATIDATIFDAPDEFSSSPALVFTSATDGYSFYVDSTGDVSYAKTINGGASWGGPIAIHGATPAVT